MNQQRELEFVIDDARNEDVEAIHGVLIANAGDHSLFQQSLPQVRASVDRFVVARDPEGRVLGCAEIKWHRPAVAEILAVAVDPGAHGVGVGSAILRACVARARSRPLTRLWLGTAKPAWFARLGFRPMSRWRLPVGVLLYKLALVFRQPLGRWLPAIFGRHVFMEHRPAT